MSQDKSIKLPPPAKMEDLPSEMRISPEDLELINKPIKDIPEGIPEPTDNKLATALGPVRDEIILAAQKMSRLDTYNIEMIDGSVVTYKRIPLTASQEDEITRLVAETEGMEDIETGRRLSQREIWLKKQELTAKQIEYYLYNTKTKQPMTMKERANVKSAPYLATILNGCILRTSMNSPEKNQ